MPEKASSCEERGLYAEFALAGGDVCPVSSAVNEREAEVTDISRAVQQSGHVVEEFTVSNATTVATDAEKMFEHDGGVVYRFERDYNDGCVCDHLNELGHPVSEVRIRGDTLNVSIRVSDRAAISDAITELREEFGSIRLEYLRSEQRSGPSELILVDRAQLTDRQQEVLRTAYLMGYFEYPREANAAEVAETLDIGPSTFMSHLVAAQAKLLDALVN